MESAVKYAQNMWSKTNRWYRVLTLLALIELDLVPGRQMGFQCKDSTLSHPFKGDSINWKWLVAITAFLPLIVMLIVERLIKIDKISYEERKRHVRGMYKNYLYVWLLHATLVEILKRLVGAPRPHFFETCMPEEAHTCQESEWVSSYHCTKAPWLTQSYRSFPSGHASLAVHAAAFLTWFLDMRRRESDGFHVRDRSLRAASVLCVCAAAVCALSRIVDRRHHERDVTAGCFIGLFAFIYTMILSSEHSTPLGRSIVINLDDPESASDISDDDEEEESFHRFSNNPGHNFRNNTGHSSRNNTRHNSRNNPGPNSHNSSTNSAHITD